MRDVSNILSIYLGMNFGLRNGNALSYAKRYRPARPALVAIGISVFSSCLTALPAFCSNVNKICLKTLPLKRPQSYGAIQVQTAPKSMLSKST